MKLAQVFLLNLATVVVALVVYDQLQSDASPTQGRASTSRSNVTDTVDLERRLSALEADSRAARTESRASNRLDASEATEQEHATPGDPAPRKIPDAAKPTKGERPSKPATSDEPTREEVRRFRQLREAVRRQESVKRNWKRVSNALDKLPVNLTEEQRELVHYKYAAFEPRIRQIWGEVKGQAKKTAAAGGQVNREEIVTTATETMQTEFVETLSDIVPHQADAEAVAEALLPALGKGKR